MAGQSLTIPFTRDWREVAGEIERSKPFGLTALVDALHLALGQMKHARNARKAIVVLSDGGDNFSRRTLRDLRGALLESDLQVYAMGIFDERDSRRRPAEERNGPRLLSEVALETGGQEFPVRGLDELSVTGVEIARDLRNQYILGYSPVNSTADGKYHRITLKVALPDASNDLRAYYRRGYFCSDAISHLYPEAEGDREQVKRIFSFLQSQIAIFQMQIAVMRRGGDLRAPRPSKTILCASTRRVAPSTRRIPVPLACSKLRPAAIRLSKAYEHALALRHNLPWLDCRGANLEFYANACRSTGG